MSVALPIRRRANVFWRRLGRTNTRRALMLCVMFGGLVALSLYRIAQPESVSLQLAKSVTMEPLGDFTKTRIGQVLYSSAMSESCRRVIFDNRTGSLYNAGHVDCSQESEAEKQPTGASRMSSMRAAFNR
jgi:hypothetical protein